MTTILAIAVKYKATSITDITERTAVLNIPRESIANFKSSLHTPLDEIEMYLTEKGFGVIAVDETTTHYEFEVEFDL